MKEFITRLGVLLGYITWPTSTKFDLSELQDLSAALNSKTYVILTSRRNALATYLLTFAHWVLTNRTYRWGHVLINLNQSSGIVDVKTPMLESLVGRGVTYSTFLDAFHNVQKVALLEPVNVSAPEWEAAVKKASVFVGRKYDRDYDFKQPDKMSCTELVMEILQGIENWQSKFPDLDKQLRVKKNITPSMFYQSTDFVTAKIFVAK